MLFGSAANLGAGSNAFQTLPHLTLARLGVYGLGAVLVAMSMSRGRWQATGGAAMGLTLMAVSERSLVTGASLWSWGRGAGLLGGGLLAASALPLIAASVWQQSRPRPAAPRPRAGGALNGVRVLAARTNDHQGRSGSRAEPAGGTGRSLANRSHRRSTRCKAKDKT